jgi:hypothetical protein
MKHHHFSTDQVHGCQDRQVASSTRRTWFTPLTENIRFQEITSRSHVIAYTLKTWGRGWHSSLFSALFTDTPHWWNLGGSGVWYAGLTVSWQSANARVMHASTPHSEPQKPAHAKIDKNPNLWHLNPKPIVHPKTSWILPQTSSLHRHWGE